tara:strand:+ start:706 stop:981 length:276 start_codon:yes stop_codon:yes gene_type:complete
MKLTKALLSDMISKKVDISKPYSKDLLDKFISIITNNVQDKVIKITNFGTFYSYMTTKRIGRNPKTKESYIIHPRIKINFKTSNKIKDTIN